MVKVGFFREGKKLLIFALNLTKLDVFCGQRKICPPIRGKVEHFTKEKGHKFFLGQKFPLTLEPQVRFRGG